ncbi:hypothetical protein PROVRETT_08008 [Providencia rettgeri DSM 1131]|nr:hypothetical protein PROVRETT_08008 [Providencia rettgeri DSM 1131]
MIILNYLTKSTGKIRAQSVIQMDGRPIFFYRIELQTVVGFLKVIVCVGLKLSKNFVADG